MSTSNINKTSTELSNFLDNQKTPLGLSKIIIDFVSGCLKIDEILESNDSLSTSKAKMTNVSGDYQTEKDIISNKILVDTLSKNTHINLIASEEVEEAIFLERSHKNLFNIFFDPLDGSSNLREQQIGGSIFSIYKNNDSKLQKGNNQIAAGYIIYSKPMMLVISLNGKTYGFAYSRKKKKFLLTHHGITIPHQTNMLYANLANLGKWSDLIKEFTRDFFETKSSNMRWSGCMVGDIHRLLMSGGIFMYPALHSNAKPLNKLRLMYEANPMAMIIRNAGGYSSDGEGDILEILPHYIHEKVPVFMGNFEKIKELEKLNQNFEA